MLAAGRMRRLFFLVAAPSACTTPCESAWTHGETADVESGPLSLTRTAYTEGLCGPAFVAAADLGGDGRDELVVSNFGKPAGFVVPNGFVLAMDHAEDMAHTELLAESDGVKWPNESHAHDIDGAGLSRTHGCS